MQKKNIVKLLAVIVFLVVVFFVRDQILELDVEGLVVERENTLKATLIIWGLFLFKALVFIIPIKIIYIAAGIVLPLYSAILVNLIGVSMGMTLTFFLGYSLGHDFVERMMDRFPRIKKVIDFSAEKEEVVAFVLRLLPISLESVSLTLGASGNRFGRYLLASLLGLLPKLIFFTMVGEALVRPLSPGLIAGMLILGVFWLLILLRVRRKFLPGKQDQPEEQENEV